MLTSCSSWNALRAIRLTLPRCAAVRQSASALPTNIMPQRRPKYVHPAPRSPIPTIHTNKPTTVNNISTCLVQQTPPSTTDAITMAPEPSDFPVSNSAPRALLIDQARQWAERALAQAAHIKAPERNEECDVGCAVATHNMGEFFEMEGKLGEARQRYEEAASLAKKMGFKDGLVNARAGIKRCKDLEKA